MATVYGSYLSPVERELSIMNLEAAASWKRVEAMEYIFEASRDAAYLESELDVLQNNGTADDLYEAYLLVEEADDGKQQGIISKILGWISQQIDKFSDWLSKCFGDKKCTKLQQEMQNVEYVDYDKEKGDLIQKLVRGWGTAKSKIENILNNILSGITKDVTVDTIKAQLPIYGTIGLLSKAYGAAKQKNKDANAGNAKYKGSVVANWMTVLSSILDDIKGLKTKIESKYNENLAKAEQKHQERDAAKAQKNQEQEKEAKKAAKQQPTQPTAPTAPPTGNGGGSTPPANGSNSSTTTPPANGNANGGNAQPANQGQSNAASNNGASTPADTSDNNNSNAVSQDDAEKLKAKMNSSAIPDNSKKKSQSTNESTVSDHDHGRVYYEDDNSNDQQAQNDGQQTDANGASDQKEFKAGKLDKISAALHALLQVIQEIITDVTKSISSIVSDIPVVKDIVNGVKNITSKTIPDDLADDYDISDGDGNNQQTEQPADRSNSEGEQSSGQQPEEQEANESMSFNWLFGIEDDDDYMSESYATTLEELDALFESL